jgi:hypothetical protein
LKHKDGAIKIDSSVKELYRHQVPKNLNAFTIIKVDKSNHALIQHIRKERRR